MIYGITTFKSYNEKSNIQRHYKDFSNPKNMELFSKNVFYIQKLRNFVTILDYQDPEKQ